MASSAAAAAATWRLLSSVSLHAPLRPHLLSAGSSRLCSSTQTTQQDKKPKVGAENHNPLKHEQNTAITADYVTVKDLTAASGEAFQWACECLHDDTPPPPAAAALVFIYCIIVLNQQGLQQQRKKIQGMHRWQAWWIISRYPSFIWLSVSISIKLICYFSSDVTSSQLQHYLTGNTSQLIPN